MWEIVKRILVKGLNRVGVKPGEAAQAGELTRIILAGERAQSLLRRLLAADQKAEKIVAPILQRSAIVDKVTRTPVNVLSASQAAAGQRGLSDLVARIRNQPQAQEKVITTARRLLGAKLAPIAERVVRPFQKAIKPITEPVRITREAYYAYRAAVRSGFGPGRLTAREVIDPSLQIVYPLIRSIGVVRQLAGLQKTGLTERVLWTGYRVYAGLKIGEKGVNWFDRLKHIGEAEQTTPAVVPGININVSPPPPIAEPPPPPSIARTTTPAASTTPRITEQPPPRVRRPPPIAEPPPPTRIRRPGLN